MVRCRWDRTADQAAEQTAHPTSGPRRRPGITSDRCTQIDEEPTFVALLAPLKRKRFIATRSVAHVVCATLRRFVCEYVHKSERSDFA